MIAKGQSGNLWLSNGWVALRWKPQTPPVQVFAIPPALQQTVIHITSIVAGPDDTAWIGVDEFGKHLGLEHFAHKERGPYKTGSFDGTSLAVEKLLLDTHNVLWVGTTNQGLYRIHDGTIDHFIAGDGLSGDSVRDLFEDHEGNLWVATTKGVDCFRDKLVATFSGHEGLSTTEVDSVFATRDGTVWTGGGNGLDAIRGQIIESYPSGKRLPGNQISSLFEDHQSQFWVGLDNNLFVLKNGTFHPIKRPNGEPAGFVTDLTEDEQGNVWAAVKSTHRELLEINDLRIRRQFSEPQMPAARRLASDSRDGLWLGLMDGDLARYRQDKVDIFRYPHGADTNISQVSVEPDGSVLGADTVGLIGWHNGKQQVLTTANGLPCDSVNSYIRDDGGAMWLSMACGLVQVSAQQLREWWSNPEIKMKVRVFDSTDGMEPGLAPYRGATKSQDGKLWFANGSVLQMLDPIHWIANPIPPPVHIEAINADGRSATPTEGMRIPALTRDVAIRYTALSFVSPQKVLFKYMLEGQDKTWQDAGTRREAFYTNLGPRSYRFRVIACNNDGLWNMAGDTIAFTIEPAYYQTTWFSVLCVLFVLALLWSLNLLRVRQARQQVEQRLGAQLEERERIARELHDTLLQGFQGLMLRFQAVISILPKDGPAQRVMESALDRADEVLLEGRQRVRNLRAEGLPDDDLPTMLTKSGKEFGFHQQTHFSVTVIGTPQLLDQEVCHDTYRIGREAIANAFHHAAATTIEVEVTYGHSAVRLRVRDDGKGISQAILDKGRDGHWGLAGMRERARKIGAKLSVWSNIGAGTEIEVEIPAKIAYLHGSAGRRWFFKKKVPRKGGVTHDKSDQGPGC